METCCNPPTQIIQLTKGLHGKFLPQVCYQYFNLPGCQQYLHQAVADRIHLRLPDAHPL
jgi:hypothetical protein